MLNFNMTIESLPNISNTEMKLLSEVIQYLCELVPTFEKALNIPH